MKLRPRFTVSDILKATAVFAFGVAALGWGMTPDRSAWIYFGVLMMVVSVASLFIVPGAMKLRFTIRDLLWLVMFAAITLACLIDTIRYEQMVRDNEALKMNAKLLQAENKRLHGAEASAKAILDRVLSDANSGATPPPNN